jgi:hypothetical protein
MIDDSGSLWKAVEQEATGNPGRNSCFLWLYCNRYLERQACAKFLVIKNIKKLIKERRNTEIQMEMKIKEGKMEERRFYTLLYVTLHSVLTI